MIKKIIISTCLAFTCVSIQCMNLENITEVFDYSDDDYFMYEAFLNDESLIIATQCKNTHIILCTLNIQKEDATLCVQDLDGSWFATLQDEHKKSQNRNNN